MQAISTPTISIIIVYWNSSEHFPRCMDCISRQTFQDFELIIMDNGSSDRGLQGVELKYPRLNMRIEQLHSNMGFAAANNLGARLAHGKWLVLLNADAFPDPEWLDRLMRAASSHPEIASFSSRQLQVDSPEVLDSAGDAYHVSGLAWHLGSGYPSEQYGLNTRQIFSPCAAAAMYLRQAFLDVDGFDEDFFSYFEDIDLGFRLQLRGYRSLYVSNAIVQHVGSGTFGVKSNFAYYYVHRNMIWTFVKNMPFAMLWRYLPVHLLANLIYLLYYALHGRGRILWKAKWDALIGLPAAVHKRKSIQAGKRATVKELTLLMEHGLFEPYLLENKRRQAVQSKMS
jgi:GT2 family glycosyltransferase